MGTTPEAVAGSKCARCDAPSLVVLHTTPLCQPCFDQGLAAIRAFGDRIIAALTSKKEPRP